MHFSWTRWDKEDTSSPGSLVLELLLAWPIRLPVVTLASGFLPILHPLLSSPPNRLIHSFTFSPPLSLSSTLFPIWPPGRCVALKQALLIEHLFRHGAGSAACGRAAGGSSRGDIMSYYISWYVLFTRMRAHLHAPMETHAATIPSKIIVASIWLKNVETQTGSFTRLF